MARLLPVALEKLIDESRTNTLLLAKGLLKFKANLTKNKEILQFVGKMLVVRGKLNLYSELIEIPDLYWSEPSLENMYKQISRNLDVGPRINILNQKLDYAIDEQRVLLSSLNEEKGSRLEWIIIYLIMFEVCLELFHFYERTVEERKKALQLLKAAATE